MRLFLSIGVHAFFLNRFVLSLSRRRRRLAVATVLCLLVLALAFLLTLTAHEVALNVPSLPVQFLISHLRCFCFLFDFNSSRFISVVHGRTFEHVGFVWAVAFNSLPPRLLFRIQLTQRNKENKKKFYMLVSSLLY